jgi:GNAT superfamily N-acetyltransferase
MKRTSFDPRDVLDSSGYMNQTVRIIEVSDASTVLNESLRERVLHSSKGHYTKHYIVYAEASEVAFLSVDPRPDLNLLVIYEIFVASENRQKGIGTRVLFAAENLALDIGFPAVRLYPQSLEFPVGEERDRATARLIQWYERHGYRATEDSGFSEWQKTI